jgi:hypothetical protein
MDMTRGEETQNSETESKTLMCFTEIITSQPILRNKAPNPAQVQIHRGGRTSIAVTIRERRRVSRRRRMTSKRRWKVEGEVEVEGVRRRSTEE